MALHHLMFYADAEILALLLEHGADVNARSHESHQRTPLHMCAEIVGRSDGDENDAGNQMLFRCAAILLARGADPNLHDAHTRTPADKCQHRHLKKHFMPLRLNSTAEPVQTEPPQDAAAAKNVLDYGWLVTQIREANIWWQGFLSVVSEFIVLILSVAVACLVCYYLLVWVSSSDASDAEIYKQLFNQRMAKRRIAKGILVDFYSVIEKASTKVNADELNHTTITPQSHHNHTTITTHTAITPQSHHNHTAITPQPHHNHTSHRNHATITPRTAITPQ
jgi:hypothetical protein